MEDTTEIMTGEDQIRLQVDKKMEVGRKGFSSRKNNSGKASLQNIFSTGGVMKRFCLVDPQRLLQVILVCLKFGKLCNSIFEKVLQRGVVCG